MQLLSQHFVCLVNHQEPMEIAASLNPPHTPLTCFPSHHSSPQKLEAGKGPQLNVLSEATRCCYDDVHMAGGRENPLLTQQGSLPFQTQLTCEQEVGQCSPHNSLPTPPPSPLTTYQPHPQTSLRSHLSEYTSHLSGQWTGRNYCHAPHLQHCAASYHARCHVSRN